MLDRAKFLIISEVSEVMRETAAAIEGRVDIALERCFTAKARTAARAKVVKAAPRASAAASAPRPCGPRLVTRRDVQAKRQRDFGPSAFFLFRGPKRTALQLSSIGVRDRHPLGSDLRPRLALHSDRRAHRDGDCDPHGLRRASALAGASGGPACLLPERHSLPDGRDAAATIAPLYSARITRATSIRPCSSTCCIPPFAFSTSASSTRSR